ncbi:C2 domain-containing protein [Lactarius psammicola]|nr:C2 domain-containing protein [Lactarius psammicola]
MDPYVQVSIGGEVKCTRVIQHSRDPVWDQQLLFHVREHDLSQPIQLTVFDWDRFTPDDCVGEAVITIANLLEGSAKKDLKLGFILTSCNP